MPYIQTCDETRLFYTDGGTGTPMVFVASAWLDSRMWDFQIPYLVDHGSGASPWIGEGTAGPTRHGPVTTTTPSPTISARCSTLSTCVTSPWCRIRRAAARSCAI